MFVTLAGAGGGAGNTITKAALEAISDAELVIGARRLLEDLGEVVSGKQTAAAILAGQVMEAIRATDAEKIAVLYSGDTGFYSGSKKLIPMLKEAGISYKVIPGISSIQLLAAALGESWQDWNLFSAHGRAMDPVTAVMKGKPAFFLTGGELTPDVLCDQLNMAGLGDLKVTVAENLGYENQHIRTATAVEFTETEFATLSVMLAQPVENQGKRFASPGIPDEEFLRGKVPMTKRDVRAAILARLQIQPGDLVWDVGAGTGSVSIEMALAAHEGKVLALECNPEGCDLIAANKQKFGTYNLQVVQGMAPEALEEFPAPDVVFLGGTKGSMKDVIRLAVSKNPQVRICATGIILESAMDAVQAMSEQGMEVTVSQIATAEGRQVSTGHMMMANNPIFIVAGGPNE